MKIAHEVAMFEDSVAHLVEGRLRQRIGKERMDLWFGGDAKWSLLGHNIVGIQVASSFIADCVSKMFRDDLQAAILEATGGDFGFQISVAEVVDEVSAADAATNTSRPNDSVLASVRTETTKSQVEKADVVSDGLRSAQPRARVAGSFDSSSSPATGSLRVVREAVAESDETLDSPTHVHVDRLIEIRRENEKRWDDFIPGDHNRLAHTAAQMVLERPGQINPLLFHGPSGTGKSHLAIGLAHKLRMTHRMRRVLVLTGEQFTIEYTESARGGGFANFRRKYRDVEAIVIDDIQFCLGKAGTLVELRNTIDMLLRDKRQVILVADRGLNELSGLGADLYARLSGGMACGIDPLDAVTRTNLLAKMCGKIQVEIPGETVRELAHQCSGDARVLQGVAHRLGAQQRILGRALTDDESLRCTLDLIRASQPVVRMTDIEKVVCDAFGLDEKMLRAKSKCQSISQPRMLAMFLARKYTRTALSEIGEYFGKRQHSTVISAQKKVEHWIESDELIGCGRGQIAVRDILKNLEATLQVG